MTRPCFQASVLVALAAGTALAEPNTADLANWRGPCYNCFNYAVNSRAVFFAQLAAPLTCANMDAQVRAAGLVPAPWDAGDPIPDCPDGCLVALVADIDSADPADHDFHWYRLNGNGNWSHKQGQRPATERGGGGQAPGTWNPTQPAARGGYETFCGFYCIPNEAVLTLNGTPSWAAIEEAARLREMESSGVELPYLPLDPPMLEPIFPLLPQGLPIPDPDWGWIPEFPGLSLQINPALFPSLPPFIVVNDGIVAIYPQIDDPTQIIYLQDEHGLEPFLRDLLQGPQGCNPADLAPPFGILDLNDLGLFVSAFVGGDLIADLDGSGFLDLTDVSIFVGQFVAGCP